MRHHIGCCASLKARQERLEFWGPLVRLCHSKMSTNVPDHNVLGPLVCWRSGTALAVVVSSIVMLALSQCLPPDRGTRTANIVYVGQDLSDFGESLMNECQR